MKLSFKTLVKSQLNLCLALLISQLTFAQRQEGVIDFEHKRK